MQFLLLKYLFMYFSQSGHDSLYASLVSGSHFPFKNARIFFQYTFIIIAFFQKKRERCRMNKS
ncbi:hypothetical protein F9B13_08920 [Bacillus subtilis]|nr:hypothetical protein DQ231_12030 [Bacillus spizizenii]MBA5715909.1 hypothetical protein [Bacillus subtilis]MUF99569.1 hypothetical protein [Bacillus tequilensis]POX35589.1 hypothetical protein C3465_00780 [Bacillus sp. Ru63]RRN60127.1 hypothetical protein EI176_08745 [Bacillus subtilis subsp. subtilis]UQZ64991.1 hypothetical protein C2H97_00170 [Bacillus subtilis PY79]